MEPGKLDVSSIVARTSRSYDALTYTSDPFPLTHPGLAGAIAAVRPRYGAARAGAGAGALLRGGR